VKSTGEKDDALGDVLRHTEPADRVPRHGLLTHRIDIVAAEIARPADKGLLAHVGLDQTRVDRVDHVESITPAFIQYGEVPSGARTMLASVLLKADRPRSHQPEPVSPIPPPC
jgi:hypothetical protein